MIKKLIVAVSIILLIAIATGCNGESKSASLRVELAKNTRTISPSDEDMEITGYRIIPTGPDGKALSTRYTYYSYCNLEDLQVGKWKIEVYAFNKSRVDIAYGEAEVMIASGSNSVTVNVDQLIGTGALDIEFTWDENSVQNPNLKLYLQKNSQGSREEELTPSITKSEARASIIRSDMEAGSYTLRGEFYDGEEKISGFIEAIRISNSNTTKGTIELSAENLEEVTDSNVNISNSTSVPLAVRIDGGNALVSLNSTFQVSLSILSSNVDINKVNAVWYLDGERIATGLDCQIKASKLGEHRIDVVVSTESEGSTGSAYSTFSTVTSTKAGMPYSLKQIDSSSISLGESNVIRFLPNSRLIIASNDKKTLELFAVEGSTLSKLKSYTYSDLSIEGKISDIAAAGVAGDSSYTVYLAVNNEPQLIALSYTKQGESLAFKARQTDITTNADSSEEGTLTKINTFGPAIGISNGNILDTVVVAASTLNHKSTGPLFLKSDVDAGETDFIEANFVYEDENYFGEGPIYSLDYSEDSELITAISGSTGIFYWPRLDSSDNPSLNPCPVSDDQQKVRNGNYESLVRGIMGRITDPYTGYGYVLTHNELYLYKKAGSSPYVPIVQQSFNTNSLDNT